MINELKSSGIRITKRLDIINGIACHLSDTEESFVRSLPFVRYIEPDAELYRLEKKLPCQSFAFSMVSQNENIDWGVKRINAPDAELYAIKVMGNEGRGYVFNVRITRMSLMGMA